MIDPRAPVSRTKAIVLVAALAGAITVAGFVCAYPVTPLFAILAGLLVVLTVTRQGRLPVLAAAAGALVLVIAQVAAAIESADPALALLGAQGSFIHPLLLDPGTWLPALLVVIELAAIAWLAHWSAGEEPSRSRTWPAEEGIEQVEREVARASQYRRQLSLSLISIDSQPFDDVARQDQAINALAELVHRELTRFDVVVRYARSTLLIILPELPAQAARAGSSLLSELASRRLGRPVRMAFVSFPDDGTSAGELISRLESALQVDPSGAAQRSRGQRAPGARRHGLDLLDRARRYAARAAKTITLAR